MTAKWTWAKWQLVMQQPKRRMRQGHYFVQSTLHTLQDPPFLCSWHFLPAMISMWVYVFLTLPLCEPREAKWASRQVQDNFKSRSDATAWAPKARRPTFGPLCIRPTILPFLCFLSFSCIYIFCGSLCSLGSMWAQQSYSAVLHLHLWWYYYLRNRESYYRSAGVKTTGKNFWKNPEESF